MEKKQDLLCIHVTFEVSYIARESKFTKCIRKSKQHHESFNFITFSGALSFIANKVFQLGINS